MDPLVNRFDNGTDPLQFYAMRVVLAHEVWGSVVSKPRLKTSLEIRAQLNESLVRIDDTLKGNMQRSAF
jgi:hypothetical protein